MNDDTALLRRFLRTVRVATHTGARRVRIDRPEPLCAGTGPVRALAAKGLEGWRFPDGGLAAADGLVVATVERDGAGAALALVLQVLGAAGLDAGPDGP